MSLEMLDDENWLKKHKDTLIQILPETWTNIQNLSIVSLMYRLKLIGIQLSGVADLATFLAKLEIKGFILRENCLIRVNKRI